MSQARPTDLEATKYAASFIVCGKKSDAFRVAFPKSKATAKSIHEKACKMHKTAKVQARIKELSAILRKQSEDDFELSVSEIKLLLKKAIDKGLKNKTDAQGNKIAVSISGAVSALAEINKMDGNHAATKLLLGGDPDAPPIETKVTVTHTVIDVGST